MKAKAFEDLIRKVVREEIDYSLSREIRHLKEDLRSEKNSTIVEHTEKVIEAPQQRNSLKEKIMGKKKPQNFNFTDNKALNDLLNETAQGDTRLEGNAPMSMTSDAMLQTAPPEVAEAITRDYSSLMKAINKKKGK
tara:strand:+ start:157 stop:564 length:408 start_codon:yes stop_codon:yes gene_type:complete